MKKILALILVVAIFSIGCARSKVINGVKYEPYGLINQDDKKVSTIQYEPCWGNVIWGALLVETIVAPIYFFGFALFNPIAEK